MDDSDIILFAVIAGVAFLLFKFMQGVNSIFGPIFNLLTSVTGIIGGVGDAISNIGGFFGSIGDMIPVV